MIKRIFILLFAAISLVSCSKDETFDMSCPELKGTWEFVSANLKYVPTFPVPSPVINGTLIFAGDSMATRKMTYSDGSTVEESYKYVIKDVKRPDESKISLMIKTTPCMIGYHDSEGYAILSIDGECLSYSDGGENPRIWVFKKKQ